MLSIATLTTMSDGRDGRDSRSASFFRASLPPSLPIVEKTIESLVAVSAKQRLFIARHADRLKLEQEQELAATSTAAAVASGVDSIDAPPIVPPEGEWRLNGFSMSDRSVLDFVRACPDSLSNLEYHAYTKTGLLTKIARFFKLGSRKEERTALNVADDLAYVLSVAEVVEINGHVLALASHALSSQSPKLGKPLKREVAFELSNSKHRGDAHGMYLLATVRHEQQNAAANRLANTLHLGLSLYLHKPGSLGVSTGVAVNVSGETTDDLPSVDVDPGELKRILANKGVFCASASSDFVLKASLPMTSERAAKVATVAVERLVDASNDAITAFFEQEAAGFAKERRIERSEIEQGLQAARAEAIEAERARAAQERAERLRAENAERLRNGERPIGEAPGERGYREYQEEDWW